MPEVAERLADHRPATIRVAAALVVLLRAYIGAVALGAKVAH